MDVTLLTHLATTVNWVFITAIIHQTVRSTFNLQNLNKKVAIENLLPEFYKYWDGACFPEDDWITLSPIETGTPQDDLITLSPIETEPIRITISPIERQPILVTLSPIETVTRPPKFYTIGPIIRQPLEVA